jgi:hypothetical protein
LPRDHWRRQLRCFPLRDFVTFEGYTTGDEIGWGDESTVYEGHGPEGESGKPLAIKVRGYLHEKEGAALIEAARQQQNAVKAGCTLVAPILVAGLNQHSCYSVTPRYARSLLTLIQGKVTVQPEGLESLSRHVLAALRQLREKAGRAHGNMKVSNILLTGTARLRDSDVFLSDLSGAAASDFAADLNALGRAIYELVRRREVHSFDWPLTNAAEWAGLGPGAEPWRAFCNALLDPALASAPDPLAVAEKALEQTAHKAIPKESVGRIAGAVAGVVALAVLGTGGWWFIHDHRQAEPSALVTQAKGEAWIGTLAEELQHDPNARSDDPYINEKILARMAALKLSASEISALQKNAAPTGANAEAIAKTAAEVKAAFDAWVARTTVGRGYDEFAALGWTIPAGSVARLRGGLSGDQPVLPQISAVAHAAKTIGEIEAKWRSLQEMFPKLEQSGNAVLSRAPAFAKSQAGEAPDLDGLLARLNDESDRFTALLALADAADRGRMQNEGKFAGFNGVVTAQVLRDWEDDAKRFRPAPDDADRLKAGWMKRLDDLAPRIPASGAGKAGLTAELSKVRADAESASRGLLAGDLERVDGTLNAEITALGNKIGAAPAPVAAAAPEMTKPALSNNPTVPAIPQLAPGDREVFEKLLAQARATDFSNASPLSTRALRDKFVADVRRGTSSGFQKDIAPFLASLSSLPFKEANAAPTGPTIPGWNGPTPGPGGISYAWGKYRLDFALIPADGEKGGFYLAATEAPIGLVIDWINEHAAWAAIDFHPQATVRGPRGWEPSGGGMALRRDWTWPTAIGSAFTFYAPPAPDPPSPMMPLNYVSSRSASLIAAQFGARLPTPEEWLRAYHYAKASGWETGNGNLRDQRWDAQRKHVADYVLAAVKSGTQPRDPPWPDGDIFLPAELRSVPRGEKARAATGEDDHHLWFEPVNAVTGKPLVDLVGNVAEFVSEGESSNARFFVVGGSALSPPEIDPATPYALSPVQKSLSFSDVGFRLALSPARSGAGGGRSEDIEAFQKALQNAPTGAK